MAVWFVRCLHEHGRGTVENNSTTRGKYTLNKDTCTRYNREIPSMGQGG